MSFISIPAIRTIDPGDPWTEKRAFRATDPFGVAVDIQVDSSVVDDGLLFDVIAQLKNPLADPFAPGTWFWINEDDDRLYRNITVDSHWNDLAFEWGTHFAVWFWWGRFDAITSYMWTPYAIKNSGIFYAHATVSVQGSNLFDSSPELPFKVRV